MNVPNHNRIARVLSAAGGKVTGRTKLQKTTFLMSITELLDEPFAFEYHYYGPYSEELSQNIRTAQLYGELKETHQYTSFGTPFSIFSIDKLVEVDQITKDFVKLTNDAESVVLELAATAAFLKLEGEADPWGETTSLKPEKASPTRIEAAQKLYAQLLQINTPTKLPTL